MPPTRKTTTKKNSKKKNSRKSSTRKTAPKKRSSTKRSSPLTKTIIREIVRTVPQTPRRFSQPQYQAPRHYQPQYQSTPQYAAQPSPSYVTSYPAAYPAVNYHSPWNDYYGGLSGLAGLGAGIRLLNEATAARNGRNGRDGRDGRVVRIKEKDVGVGGVPPQMSVTDDRVQKRGTDTGTGLVIKTFPGPPGTRLMPDLRQTVAGNTGGGRVMMANPNRFERASSGTAAGGIGGQANLGANP